MVKDKNLGDISLLMVSNISISSIKKVNIMETGITLIKKLKKSLTKSILKMVQSNKMIH